MLASWGREILGSSVHIDGERISLRWRTRHSDCTETSWGFSTTRRVEAERSLRVVRLLQVRRIWTSFTRTKTGEPPKVGW